MSADKPPSPNGPGKPSWLERLSRLFGREPRDREQFKRQLKDARERSLLDAEEETMLQGVLEVAETQVGDIMIPRSQMVVLERDKPPEELMRTIIASGHSRFPVIGDDISEVAGILLAKDLLRYYAEGASEKFDIRECLRPAVFIPESKRLNTLLREFRSSHNHMAIVVDEYGGVSGLLTIEDVLEQIVGDIDDEHDIQGEAEIVAEGDGKYSVLALTRIEDFNEYFGARLDDEEYDTIGGLVSHQFGRLPRRGEKVELQGCEFRVTRAHRRRIEALQVTPPKTWVVSGESGS
ncbi:MAG: magnesium/cobalt efflux protein [Chromatiales bacterium]|nr:MAG: magnesium/cobalt efflux protein [Chromatiales bacterium]